MINTRNKLSLEYEEEAARILIQLIEEQFLGEFIQVAELMNEKINELDENFI